MEDGGRRSLSSVGCKAAWSQRIGWLFLLFLVVECHHFSDWPLDSFVCWYYSRKAAGHSLYREMVSEAIRRVEKLGFALCVCCGCVKLK